MIDRDPRVLLSFEQYEIGGRAEIVVDISVELGRGDVGLDGLSDVDSTRCSGGEILQDVGRGDVEIELKLMGIQKFETATQRRSNPGEVSCCESISNQVVTNDGED